MTPTNKSDNLRSRVRSGCASCRRRHVKCDETQPICRRCTSAKISCSYAFRLTWEEDALSAGKCHGRSGVWSKHGHSSNPVPQEWKSCLGLEYRFEIPEGRQIRSRQTSHNPFFNTTVAHMRLYYGGSNPRVLFGKRCKPPNLRLYCGDLEVPTVLENQSNSTFRISTHTPLDHLYTPISDFPFTSNLKPTEIFLLEYYTTVICHDATHIRRDDENDPLPYILLRSYYSRALFLGVMMLAANLLSLKNPKYVVLALRYRSLVLKALGEILKSGSDESVAIFLACMLCSSEVRDGSDTSVTISRQWFPAALLTTHRYGPNNPPPG